MHSGQPCTRSQNRKQEGKPLSPVSSHQALTEALTEALPKAQGWSDAPSPDLGNSVMQRRLQTLEQLRSAACPV